MNWSRVLEFSEELGGIENLQNTIIQCRKCNRLISYLREIEEKKPKRFNDWSYWSKPLPSFGDPNARLLIIGLAPAAHGGNRTGRMFTGDRSGEWLFEALYKFGFSNQPTTYSRDDNLYLNDCYITATIHCAPPMNKPLPEEIENCRTYILTELSLLKNIKIIIPLGQIAFIQILKSLRKKGLKIPPLGFGHGKVFELTNGLVIMPSYHPSQQNTQTGKLTRSMFHQIFKKASDILLSRD